MFGNIAIEGYIEELQKWIEKYKESPDFLELLQQKLENDRSAANGGWL